ncbi:MAG TPA: RidA family protein [Ktedonobacterales bacterium]|nr:RidA family protein [Ktedonobacterales bacterium]
MTLQFVNPHRLPQPTGYTHVVEATGTRTIYISGQVALDADGNVVGPGNMRAQALQVFANLQAALEAVGANFNDVAKLTLFVLDVSQMAVVREVRDQYVNGPQPPASTAVEVRRLVRDEFLIEVEAVAVVS